VEEGRHDVMRMASEDRDAIAGGTIPDTDRLVVRAGYLLNMSV